MRKVIYLTAIGITIASVGQAAVKTERNVLCELKGPGVSNFVELEVKQYDIDYAGGYGGPKIGSGYYYFHKETDTEPGHYRPASDQFFVNAQTRQSPGLSPYVISASPLVLTGLYGEKQVYERTSNQAEGPWSTLRIHFLPSQEILEDAPPEWNRCIGKDWAKCKLNQASNGQASVDFTMEDVAAGSAVSAVKVAEIGPNGELQFSEAEVRCSLK